MTVITTEHLQRAFDLARRPDWPTDLTLAELMVYARRAALVQGLALRLSKGQSTTLPHAPSSLADCPPEPVRLRASDYPTSARTNGLTERRRRDDRTPALDLKRLASGERADDL
ncbi:hypothetical protein [Pelomonas sp. Root1444]|uniref:hypothetical protein n=1 Tax=Pelomonas sp. Root1444 TaxID=1736464 RepID=UPI00070267E9|nr:hypothetical protein [Pelomonas sp. Root1444]KQY83722.1 hypothetical protein ASD35_24175 [Pelomonas sp. Root1444]